MSTQPSNHEIAQQAYLLWESEGCQHGSDVQYWLRAEKLLKETSNGNGAKSTKKNSKATFIPPNKNSEARSSAR